MKKDDAIYPTSLFSGIPLSDFMDIVLSKDERADEAMYYLLHHCLNFQLRQRFEVYRNQLLDDFDDVIMISFSIYAKGKREITNKPINRLGALRRRSLLSHGCLTLFAIISVGVPLKREISFVRDF